MQLGALIACWGEPLGGNRPLDPSTPLGAVCTDSRQLAPGQLFVPLVGERFDGHTFLPLAASVGAQAAVIQRDRAHAAPAGLLHWLVDDTLEAYQQLATLHRRALSAPVVAVTGSAGKTTTRELIRAALEPLGGVMASSGNENNDIGVPLTLLKADLRHRAVVVEMGMRGLGEIDRLSRKSQQLAKEIYARLTPWQVTQIARHPLPQPYLGEIRGVLVERLLGIAAAFAIVPEHPGRALLMQALQVFDAGDDGHAGLFCRIG